jgi:hypothetical protein
MPLYIEPHTEQWFTALEAEEPGVARQIRELLLSAGRADACSLCGSVPARDYWVVARPTDPTPVPTLRVCEQCVSVREGVYQQRLIPVGPKPVSVCRIS